MECFIKSGVFYCFEKYRSQLVAVYEGVMDSIAGERKRQAVDQLSFFEAGLLDEEDHAADISYPSIPEYKQKVLLQMEKEMLGLYVSGNPLEEYTEVIGRLTWEQVEEYFSKIPLNESLQNPHYVEVDYTSEDELARGGILFEDLINKLRGKHKKRLS